ncbi:hypothetical protein [Phyllobacterium endophyticum]|uniref:hypothetical protein n=1 Tax=Phyllobacterium endophyticum TaxID=1149773 RepID=UPI0011C7BE94|nr:hypothetical protein [Phyllobacterium endophyticum]TXR49881.1 hypothetical protein FVA77_07660 [Phyllobacterium endophyticum]
MTHNPNHYFVKRCSLLGKWHLYKQREGFEELLSRHPYKTRKAALTAGRLLAGWSGIVEVR